MRYPTRHISRHNISHLKSFENVIQTSKLFQKITLSKYKVKGNIFKFLALRLYSLKFIRVQISQLNEREFKPGIEHRNSGVMCQHSIQLSQSSCVRPQFWTLFQSFKIFQLV